jgi:hypothetical protein
MAAAALRERKPLLWPFFSGGGGEAVSLFTGALVIAAAAPSGALTARERPGRSPKIILHTKVNVYADQRIAYHNPKHFVKGGKGE